MFGFKILRDSEIKELQETVTLAQRTLEDVGWVSLNDSNASYGSGMNFVWFKEMLKKVKLMWYTNPLAGHWVNLTTWFVFGVGVSEPKSKEEDVQEAISEFWNDPDNKISITGFLAQQKNSAKIQYEGNLFFVLFTDMTGDVRARMLNTDEIADIIYDPEDRMRPVAYKVKASTKKYNYGSDSYSVDSGVNKWKYYLDISVPSANMFDIPQNKIDDDQRVFHVRVNCDTNDKYGIPDLYRGVGWMEAHKNMAQDVATLVKSLSKFAWNKKVKGSAAQVSSIAAGMKTNTSLSNITRPAGQTHVENEGIDTKAISTPTGGAVIGEKGMKSMQLMVSAASGYGYHYFGDPSTGNLATAKTMELPIIKKIEAYQKIWENIFLTIINYMLMRKIEANALPGKVEIDSKHKRFIVTPAWEEQTVDVDFPPILEKDIKETADGLSVGLTNDLISKDSAAREFLLALNMNNIDDEIEKIKKDVELKKEEAPVIDPNVVPNVDPKGNPIVDPKEKKVIKEAAIEGQEKEVNSKISKRFDRKYNFMTQRTKGYAKTLAGYFNQFHKSVKEGIDAGGDKGQVVGTVKGLDRSLRNLAKGMKSAANSYFKEAVDVGRDYTQATLKDLGVAIEETLFEAEGGDMKKFLAERIESNAKFIDESLIPAIEAKVMNDVRQSYETKQGMSAAINKSISTFRPRIDLYVGAFWTTEEAAVREAGKGTPIMVNFAGPSDSGTCAGCNAAVEGSPWPIDSVPMPGEQECLGNCRHAIQVIPPEDGGTGVPAGVR